MHSVKIIEYSILVTGNAAFRKETHLVLSKSPKLCYNERTSIERSTPNMSE
jgi:hypothetical protein